MGKKRRRIQVIGERRSKPDLKKLSQALIELARAQAEAAAAAEHQQARSQPKTPPGDAA